MLKDYEFDDDDYKPDELQNDVLLIDFYDGAQLFQLKTCESLQHVKRGLEIEVIEMICLYEGLFPDDQNSFQLHQIMDLVSSIPLHDSMLYAWSLLLKNTRKILLKHPRNVAFYRHFDLRVQVVYGRITKEQHLAAAREAREKNAKRKTVEEFKVKGFKDVWPFDRLPYSDLARNSSIPLHGSMLYAWGELLKNTRKILLKHPRKTPTGR